MSPEEATSLNLDEGMRRSLIRVDSGKTNIVPAATEAKWFKLVSINLANADAVYSGDQVQTVELFVLPGIFTGLSNQTLNQILDEIAAGLPNGDRFTDAAKAGEREAWRVIARHYPSKPEAHARKIIQLWLRSGLLFREEYKNADSKTRQGLSVDNGKRPS